MQIVPSEPSGSLHDVRADPPDVLRHLVVADPPRACSRSLQVSAGIPASAPPDCEKSHAAILNEAAQLATVIGIDGLSIARLAESVGMSKSGLCAHFGSKEELQIATIKAATRQFSEHVGE